MISDRKDYYHQIWVRSARSSTNAVGPAIYLEMLKDAFFIDSAMKRRACREVRGGGLHNFALHPGECLDAEVLPEGCCWACFGSILQGDGST